MHTALRDSPDSVPELREIPDRIPGFEMPGKEDILGSLWMER
jgi:hypothetical protein